MEFFWQCFCFFSILSRLFKAFLPRSKCLLISWLQSPYAVILDPHPKKKNSLSLQWFWNAPKIKSVIVSSNFLMIKDVKVKVTQSCPTLCDSMVYTVHGILQAKILKWLAFLFSRGSSQLRDRTQVSHIAGRFYTSLATREAQWLDTQQFFMWLFPTCLFYFQKKVCPGILPF